MTTQPPQQPPSYQRPYYGPGMPQMGMPNPEFLVYVLALAVVALVAAVSDSVIGAFWVEFAKWATAAYLITRGLTKFGKGTEGA